MHACLHVLATKLGRRADDDAAGGLSPRRRPTGNFLFLQKSFWFWPRWTLCRSGPRRPTKNGLDACRVGRAPVEFLHCPTVSKLRILFCEAGSIVLPLPVIVLNLHLFHTDAASRALFPGFAAGRCQSQRARAPALGRPQGCSDFRCARISWPGCAKKPGRVSPATFALTSMSRSPMTAVSKLSRTGCGMARGKRASASCCSDASGSPCLALRAYAPTTGAWTSLVTTVRPVPRPDSLPRGLFRSSKRLVACVARPGRGQRGTSEFADLNVDVPFNDSRHLDWLAYVAWCQLVIDAMIVRPVTGPAPHGARTPTVQPPCRTQPDANGAKRARPSS